MRWTVVFCLIAGVGAGTIKEKMGDAPAAAAEYQAALDLYPRHEAAAALKRIRQR